jgi:hypothetical protein
MLTKRREMIDERIKKGDSLETKRKKYIDFTLRNYIKNQLEALKDLPDAINALPRGQTKKLFKQISDDVVFTLLRTAIEIMRAKGFRQLVGDPENPDKWETMAFTDAKKPYFEKVENIDIIRSIKFDPLLRDLLELKNMSDDPVSLTAAFQRAHHDPGLLAVLKSNPEFAEKYRKAEDRIAIAISADES